MASVVQKGKKRGKAQYLSGAKRQKYCKQLEVGMQGILITCNMNERKCVGEAYNLLNEYGDLLYGSEKLCEKDDHDTNSEAEDDDDIEAALKKEVDQIRSSTKKNLRRFQSVESGANNVVFIKTFDVDPEKLVHHILKDLYTTKKRKSRVIYRMIPVTGTCKAFPEDLKKYAETFFQPWFKAPNKGTFQVVYKSRNNNHMNRDDVIKDLAGIVVSQNSENKVDLSNPEYTIVVEIIKSVCCLSVVKDYPLFRKYNLQEVAKGDREEKPQDPASDGKQKEQKPQDPASDGKEKEQKPQDPASDGKEKEQKPQDPASDGKEKEQVPSEDNPATAAKTDVQQA